MPDQVDRLVGRFDDREGGIVREVRFEQAQPRGDRWDRARIGMNVDDVPALELVNVARVREQAVEKQEAEIGDSGLRKRRQAHESLQNRLLAIIAA